MKAVTILVLWSLACFCALPCFSQEITGNIEGLLVDENGDPVPFANVNVTSPSLQGPRGVMTTAEGYFGIFKLPVGVYIVKISHRNLSIT